MTYERHGRLTKQDLIPTFKELNFSKAGAVQNIWYEAFSGKNVKFDGLAIKVTVADETVETRITLDGVVLTSGGMDLLFASNAHSQVNVIRLTNGTFSIQMVAPAVNVDMSGTCLPWCKGKDVKVEIRKTTAGGASAILCYGIYHQIA